MPTLSVYVLPRLKERINVSTSNFSKQERVQRLALKVASSRYACIEILNKISAYSPTERTPDRSYVGGSAMGRNYPEEEQGTGMPPVIDQGRGKQSYLNLLIVHYFKSINWK